MKTKTQILLLLAMIAMLGKGAEAQVQDTVVRDTNYYYQWWTDQWLAEDSSHSARVSHFDIFPMLYNRGSECYPPRGIYLQYNYSPERIWVYGLATVARVNREIVDTMWTTEYLYLYDATPDSFILKKSMPWRIQDDYHYFGIRVSGWGSLETTHCTQVDPSHPWVDGIVYYPIREYYFDKPVHVMDSFYVGGSSFCNFFLSRDELRERYDMDNWGSGWGSYVESAAPSFTEYKAVTNGLRTMGFDCDTLDQKFKFWVDPAVATNLYGSDFPIPVFGQWYWRDLGKFMLVFPITGIRDSSLVTWGDYECPGVMNVRVADRTEDCAVVMWDVVAGQELWELSFGPSGTAPEDGTRYTCHSQVKNLCGLDSSQRYVAYVRARCTHNDSLYWSDWSDSLVIANGQGLTLAQAAKETLTVAPNPATEMMTIVSESQVERLTVYDVEGRQVFGESPESRHISIDVSMWKKGCYFVQARTERGIAVRRVVVK